MNIRTKISLGFGSIVIVIIVIALYNIVFLNGTNSKVSALVESKNSVDQLIRQLNSDVMTLHSDILDALLLNRPLKDAKIPGITGIGLNIEKSINLITAKSPSNSGLAQKIKASYSDYNSQATLILSFKDNDELNRNLPSLDQFKKSKEALIYAVNEFSSNYEKEFSTSLLIVQESFKTNKVILFVVIIVVLVAGLAAVLIMLKRPKEEVPGK